MYLTYSEDICWFVSFLSFFILKLGIKIIHVVENCVYQTTEITSVGRMEVGWILLSRIQRRLYHCYFGFDMHMSICLE